MEKNLKVRQVQAKVCRRKRRRPEEGAARPRVREGWAWGRQV